MANQAVVRQSLKEQIETILIDRIIKGDLAPGDRIKELTVAKEFGTSQAPVREAIRCIETLGYADHVPHVGAMVKTFDKSQIKEAYQAREALEIYALPLISKGQDRLVVELETCLAKMEHATKERDNRKFAEADNLFHRTIVSYCNNKTMLAIWESLKMQSQIMTVLVDTTLSIHEIYELHPPIVAAIKDENSDAVPLLKGHYKILEGYWESSK